ncbi:DUF4174 domain-containing protein [Nodularia sp. NIES-3585]|uniref:DUF4174 domain-containing protein n=1 Tax=Nodularia sp. NIES-3585 TaxID=1973477 RepID=UPI000B5D039D|nr:DUF4174 domain-containing protein [Nodularia sp. NIES-3585]GAX38572.1 hypothetical protein NIES3585_46210 [Nodularia sp. NIES-3585]
MLIHPSILLLLLITATGYSIPNQFLDRGSGRLETAPTTNLVMAFNLNSYQWKNRLLLVFAPSENSPDYKRQMQLLKGQEAGFPERDLLLIEVFTEGTSRALGKTLDQADVDSIRKQFNINPQEFQTVLVGKDGKSKRRDQKPVLPEVIFQVIDAMPMRQREMHRGN